MIQETLPELYVIIADVVLLVGFYGVLHTTFIGPEKTRRKELYDRLNNIEQEQIHANAWREAHGDTHRETLAKIDRLISMTSQHTEALHAMDKRLALMEQREEERDRRAAR
ncbi:hypothetical protein [Candidatus Poriferisocius sp.]|uniref:hypothetical protein n=1 Tax=Candidatus Poriferisocius sp. TaxID=3101276 RepID=UPI003B0137EF